MGLLWLRMKSIYHLMVDRGELCSLMCGDMEDRAERL